MRSKAILVAGMVVCVVLTLVNITVSYGYTSFDISQYPGVHDNALGLAVNPQNGNIFLSALSYGGEDNLYEFNSNGDLIYSTRAAFETGPRGNLDSMVVGKDGHLFLGATYYDVQPSENYIIEMSQDGQTIFSSLPNMNAHVGISYSPQTDNLFFVERLSPMNYQINEITPEGTLISQFDLEEPMVSEHYKGLVYDPLSEDFYINELYGYANILDQYSKNELDEYVYVMSYDMKTILSGTVLALDINRSNGLFYASDNEEVFIFSLDELDSYYIPEPTTLLLLGLGAVMLRTKR